MRTVVFAAIFIIAFSMIQAKPPPLDSTDWKEGRISTSTSASEIIGLWIFMLTNLVFSAILAKDVMKLMDSFAVLPTYTIVRAIVIIIAIGLNMASSIMLILTMLKLRQTFLSANLDQIHLSPEDRANLDKAEVIFITAVTFLFLSSLTVYMPGNDIYNTCYEIFNYLLKNQFAHFLRVVLPFVALGVGSALYDKMVTSPLNQKWCNPGQGSDPNFDHFRHSFINTYWLLFGLVGLFVVKYLMDNYGIPLLLDWKYIDTSNPIVIPGWGLVAWLFSCITSLLSLKFGISPDVYRNYLSFGLVMVVLGLIILLASLSRK